MLSEHHPKLHYHSLKNAWRGVTYAVATQRNFRLEVLMAGLALALAVYLGFSIYELAAVGAVTFLVLGTELVNTAVEAMVDSVHVGENDLARISKDASAAAVLLAVLAAVTVGVVLYLPPLLARIF